MLTLTQRELLQLRQVASKTFGRLPATRPVTISGDESGTRLTMRHAGITLVYTSPEAADTPTEFSVQLAHLAAFARASDEPVTFDFDPVSQVCTLHYGRSHSSTINVEPTEPLPEPTAAIASAACPPGVLQQLADCCTMTDRSSSRFALHCIQLDGGLGTMAATDGRKALRITGCGWPWENDRLIPACGWFASAVVHRSARWLDVDDLGDGVRFTAGPWSLELTFESHRYPQVYRVFPARWQANTVIRLTDDDLTAMRQFVRSLPKRVSKSATTNAVTLEATSDCVLRFAPNDGVVTEVRLPHATRSGLPLVIALPRHALADMARLGFEELLITAGGQRLWCEQAATQFAFMPLHPDFAVRRTSEPATAAA